MAESSKDLSPKEYRKAKGVGQKQVAHVLGRSKSSISMWESGGYRPKRAKKGKVLLTEEMYKRIVDDIAGINKFLLQLPKSQRAARERKLLNEARKKLRDPLLYLVKQAIRGKSRRS